MKDTQEELERIQEELFAEDTVSLEAVLEDPELNALLDDKDLNQLLWQQEEAPEQTENFQNFANGYTAEAKTDRDEKLILILMGIASGLCLGIIGVLGYWLAVLL